MAIVEYRHPIVSSLDEDEIWRDTVAPSLQGLGGNAVEIWQFCVTEMLNNAIDHSEGKTLSLDVTRISGNTEILVRDDGIGIFRKIQERMKLPDERRAILELSKGKLTTDPDNHSGQGIFFTSRLLDSFHILSGDSALAREPSSEEDWFFEMTSPAAGTAVFMKLRDGTPRTCEEVFRSYSSADGYDFARTVVPVKLALYGQEKLISRSQAKRIVTRIDLFRTVALDFQDIDVIGPAFADQIFRVFVGSHPDVVVHPINVSDQVRCMIAATGFRI